MFENRILGRKFRPKREEVTEEWRKLHSKEHHNSDSSPYIFRLIITRRMKWAGCAARMGEMMNAYKNLICKPEGKRPLIRYKRRKRIILR
jgi:hypothetical protein